MPLRNLPETPSLLLVRMQAVLACEVHGSPLYLLCIPYRQGRMALLRHKLPVERMLCEKALPCQIRSSCEPRPLLASRETSSETCVPLFPFTSPCSPPHNAEPSKLLLILHRPAPMSISSAKSSLSFPLTPPGAFGCPSHRQHLIIFPLEVGAASGK